MAVRSAQVFAVMPHGGGDVLQPEDFEPGGVLPGVCGPFSDIVERAGLVSEADLDQLRLHVQAVLLVGAWTERPTGR